MLVISLWAVKRHKNNRVCRLWIRAIYPINANSLLRPPSGILTIPRRTGPYPLFRFSPTTARGYITMHTTSFDLARVLAFLEPYVLSNLLSGAYGAAGKHTYPYTVNKDEAAQLGIKLWRKF